MTHPSPRRVVPIRTVALETLADLQAFRSALDKRFALPRVRIALRIPQLRGAQYSEDERRINRLLAANGYGLGAVLAVLLLGLAIAFPLRPAGAESSTAIGAWVAQGQLALVLGIRGGMVIGLAIARRRLLGICKRVEAACG